MSFRKGVATFKLKAGQEIKATGIPGDMRYEVTETPDADFSTTSAGVSGAISPTREATATFTNTRKTGKLVISKAVDSDVSSDRSQNYSFTIRLGNTVESDGDSVFVTDTTLNKRYGSATFAKGVATITLKPSTGTASTTLSGLPQGIEYQVTEESVAHMTTTVGENQTDTATGTISASVDSEAAFTNTRDKGYLTITKQLVSDLASDKDLVFTFTVKLDTVSETYSMQDKNGNPAGQITFTNGTGTLTLKGGESKTIEGLPEGISYTVSETANSNFTTEKTGDRGVIETEIETDETTGKESNVFPEAVFTNTRKTGDLHVTKRVVSDLAGDADKAFSFTVTLKDTSIGKVTEDAPNGKTFGGMTFKNGVAEFELKKGESITANDLPTTLGYTVTEESVDGFTMTASNDEGSITTDRTDVVLTNTRETGNLQVKKELVSDLAADANESFTFTVKLDDISIGKVTDDTPNGKTFGGMTFKNGVAEFTLKGGQSLTATDLPAGIGYTVEETTPNGFVVKKENAKGEIPTSDTAVATVTNTRKTGTLKITKHVESDLAADKTVGFKFNITLTGLSAAARNKPYGDIEFKNGVATVTLKDGEWCKIGGLPVGAGYTVKESLTTAQKADYTTTPDTSSCTGTIGEVSLSDAVDASNVNPGQDTSTLMDELTGEDKTEIDEVNLADFTNTRFKGDLVITKTLVSDLAADKDVKFNFTITLTDTSINAVYPCTVESMGGNAEDAETDNVSFEDGVAKVILKGGEKITITGLPTDVKATVKEILDADQKADYTTVPSNLTRSVTIGAASHTAAFTNTRKTGKLTVKKTLVSALPSDKEQKFEFTVSLGRLVTVEDDENGQTHEEFRVDETLSKQFGAQEFKNGVAQFKLRGGESKTVTGLPKGIVYVVGETLADDQKDSFDTDPSDARVQGIISNTATSTVTIKNTRKTGDLVVTKKLENGLSTDASRKFNFTVKLGSTDADGNFVVDEGVGGSFGEVTVRKGVGTFTLTGGTSKKVANVPIGMTYVVSETATSGFIPVSEKTGTIVVNTTEEDAKTGEETAGCTETFTNKRAICKITDGDGNLLYEDAGHTIPAAYPELTTEVAIKIAGTLYRSDGKAYDGPNYYLKMLVQNYNLAASVEIGQNNKTVTLTTAATTDKDGFPYTGNANSASTITRDFTRRGSMFAQTAGSLTVENITLDGALKYEAEGETPDIPNNIGRVSKSSERGEYQRGGIICVGINNEDYTKGAASSKGIVLNVNSGALLTRGKANKGGAIYGYTGSTIYINAGAHISNCEATASGGAIYTEIVWIGNDNNENNNYVNYKNGYLAIGEADGDKAIIESCEAGSNGGAVYSTETYVRVNNADIKNNSAGNNGGGICIDTVPIYSYSKPDAEIKDSVIVGNRAQVGGGVCSYSKSKLTVINTVVSDNRASSDAGGIRAGTEFSMTGGEISNNKAGRNGGGFYTSAAYGKTVFSGTYISDNSAATGGGGYAGDVSLRNGVTITGNVVTNINSASGAGLKVSNKLTLGVEDGSKETTSIFDNHTSDSKDSNLCLALSTDGTTKVKSNKPESIKLLCKFTGKICVSNPGDPYTQFGVAGAREFLPDPGNEEHMNTASSSELVSEARIVADDETDLIGRMDWEDTSATNIRWYKKAIAKITDADGNLLYKADGSPAIYVKLYPYNSGTKKSTDMNAAFSVLNNDTPALYRESDDRLEPYSVKDKDGDVVYNVEMLDDYTIRDQIYVDTAGKKFTFTTASTAATDGYSYRGKNKNTETPYAEIDRGRSFETGAQKDNPYFIRLLNKSHLTLKNITMDGGSERGLVTAIDGPFVNLFNESTLIIDEGTTLQNANSALGGLDGSGGALDPWGGGAVCHGLVGYKTTIIMKGGTIKNCHTNKNGGAIGAKHGNNLTVIAGGTIENCSAEGYYTDANDDKRCGGGAIYLGGKGSKLYILGGTIKDCQAPNGAAIYVDGGWNGGAWNRGNYDSAQVTIGGNTYTDLDGHVVQIGTDERIVFENNWNLGDVYNVDGYGIQSDVNYSSLLNGGKAVYADGKIRQDIYLPSLNGGAADAIVLGGKIHADPGSIWVWANNPYNTASTSSEHYENEQQFAVVADDATVDDESYKAFRNALADGVTKNTAEADSGLYLTGWDGDDIDGKTCVYWGPLVTGKRKVILRKVGKVTDDSYESLAGVELSIYRAGATTPLYSSMSKPSGVFFVGELDVGTYEIEETGVGENGGYSVPSKRFAFKVDLDKGVTDMDGNPIRAIEL